MPFTKPNQTAALYPAQARLFSTDFDVLADGYAGIGVLGTGCAVTAQGSPNMTVAVAAGVIRVGTTNATVTGGNVTITTADATNPRIDLVVSNSSGTLSAVAGTAAATPLEPARSASTVVLAQVYVPAGATTITTPQIYDMRILLPDAVVNVVVAGRAGTLVAETAGTTKTVKWLNRTGRTITFTAAYALVDTAPTGSAATVTIWKNGSATGAVTVSISAAATSGSTTGLSLSIADGDYVQAWPTGVGSTVPGTDLSVTLVGTAR